MKSLIIHPTAQLDFAGCEIAIYDVQGQPWLRGSQIGAALGYAGENKIRDLYRRNKSEFSPDMSAIITIPTGSGSQQARVFSPRGAALLAMKAQTPRAAEFRAWVLDVLEGKRPAAPPAKADRLAEMEAELAQLRKAAAALAPIFFQRYPKARAILRYHGMGLNQLEIGRLVGIGRKQVGVYLRQLEALGLVAPPPRIAAMRQHQARVLMPARAARAEG